MHLLISSSTCTSTDALVHLLSTFFWQWHLCNHNVEDLTLCWYSTYIGSSVKTISLPILFEVSLLDVSNKYYLQTFPHQRLIDSWMLTKLREKNRFLSHAYLWPLWPLQVLHLRFTPLPLNDCLSEWISTGKQGFGKTRMVYLGIFTPTASSESTPMSSNRLAFDFGHDSSIESRMSEAMRFLFLHAVTVLVWAPWIASFSSALVTFGRV